MPRLRHSIALFALLCLAPWPAWAQRVYWDPPGGRLGLGKTEPVSLVFEDCSPVENFRLPKIPGLDFGEPSESQQTSVINFQMTTRVVLTFPVRAEQRGSAVIPAFDALTNKGKIAVGEVRFEVGDAGVGPSGISINDIVASQLKTSRTTPWAGELVDFEYLLTASSRYNVSLAGEPTWSPAGLILEPFGQREGTEATVGGERRQAVRYRARGIFSQSGPVALDPVRQLVNVQTGERAVGFFSQPRIEQFTVDSSVPPITVRPLPQPAPSGFRGAVGSFTLESTIVPQTARIGEPITWTLTLSGTGNWTSGLSLPEREVSSDFQVVQPKTRTEMEKGRLFEGKMIEDAVLVPTTAGTYSLGPVSLTYFDPAAGQYRTQTVPAVSVRIDPVRAGLTTGTVPNPADTPSPAVAPDTGLPGASVASPAAPLPSDVAAPAPLPGSPLPVGTSAATPRKLPLGWLIATPLAGPLLCWLLLAVAQAIRTDPTRERRLALRELRRFVRGQARNPTPMSPASLERWRTLVARIWAIRRATPTAEDLAAALATTRGATRPEEWIRLWNEAETAMFSIERALPSDWMPRAAAAAATARIRPGRSWWPIRPEHWAPRLAIAVIVFIALAAGMAEAAEARDAYRAGRFAEAHDAWLAHLQRHPVDWAAHLNVSLTASQLDAWPEAHAHAAAATVLCPRSEPVRQQLRLTATHMDGIDPIVRKLVEPVWYDVAVFWLSPGEWQNVIVGSVVVLGLAFLALVSSLYWMAQRVALRAAGQAMLVVGSVFLVAAGGALHQYGPLADPEAAMIVRSTTLQSIPTDLADKQKSVPITAGSIVVVERDFLGWQRISATPESAGWIRRDALVPLYLSHPTPAEAAGH